METKQAVKRVIMWISLALTFNLGVLFFAGSTKALEFLGGYMIELSLSVDNLFVFLILFASFGIPTAYQKKVLNYGIFGAIILRLIFILLGINIVNRLHWVLYIFGIILIFSGIKMVVGHEKESNHKDSKLIKVLSKVIPVTDTLEGERFFVRKNNILHATPLFALVILIEFSDILFAIDSIPAIFSITTDAFIVYTSNIFAILGLRSLYFVLGALQEKFQYVKFGVALILMFTGVKLSILYFDLEIPIIISLAVIFTILVASVVLSILISSNKAPSKVEAAPTQVK